MHKTSSSWSLMMLLAVFPLATVANDEVRSNNPRERGWLGMGFCYHEDLDGPSQPQVWLSVDGLAPNGPAQEAGLEVGDLIVAITEITQLARKPYSFTSESELLRLLRGIHRGTVLEIKLVRAQSTKTVQIRAGALPNPTAGRLTKPLNGTK